MYQAGDGADADVGTGIRMCTGGSLTNDTTGSLLLLVLLCIYVAEIAFLSSTINSISKILVKSVIDIAFIHIIVLFLLLLISLLYI